MHLKQTKPLNTCSISKIGQPYYCRACRLNQVLIASWERQSDKDDGFGKENWAQSRLQRLQTSTNNRISLLNRVKKRDNRQWRQQKSSSVKLPCLRLYVFISVSWVAVSCRELPWVAESSRVVSFLLLMSFTSFT